jgi:hypothetical protein
MAASSPRQLMILGVLGVLLVGVLYYQMAPGGEPQARPLRPVPIARAQKDGAPIAVDPVRLDVLKRTRPEPGEADRDPFSFEARRSAPSPTAGTGTSSTPDPVVPTPVTEPQGPPPPPPITLRFIGILNAASTSKIAVLSDGKGNVFYGREGETIDGRYRIDHIGVESIDMAWTDGRGHQVIRLSGS